MTVEFTLSDTPNGTYTITKDGKYLNVNGIENGSETVWSGLSDSSYWNIENTVDGRITIQNCSTGKSLTVEDGKWLQRNFTGEDNQLFNGSEFDMTRLTELKDVIIIPDSFTVTATAAEGYSVSLDVRVTGSARAPEKAEVVGITAADEGWSSAWKPELTFDGIPSTAYSSKDDSPAKYIQVELAEPAAITSAYVYRPLYRRRRRLCQQN